MVFRNITRIVSLLTCEVTLYDRETKQVKLITAEVTGYTAPNDVEEYLFYLYNNYRYILQGYRIVRKRLIKCTMDEVTFRVYSEWDVFYDSLDYD